MQDWSVAVGLIVVAITWVQIFMNYRKRLMKIMPPLQRSPTARATLPPDFERGDQRREHQDVAGGMRREAERPEDQRLELQARLNPLEMALIPSRRFRMGNQHHCCGYYRRDPGARGEPEGILPIKVLGHQHPVQGFYRDRTFSEARKSDYPMVNAY